MDAVIKTEDGMEGGTKAEPAGLDTPMDFLDGQAGTDLPDEGGIDGDGLENPNDDDDDDDVENGGLVGQDGYQGFDDGAPGSDGLAFDAATVKVEDPEVATADAGSATTGPDDLPFASGSSQPDAAPSLLDAQLEQALARIDADPYDEGQWVQLLSEARTRPIEVARVIFRRFFKVFPTAGLYWKQYVELEMASGNASEVDAALNSCLKECPHVELWRCYVRHVQQTPGCSAATLEQAFEFTLEHVGQACPPHRLHAAWYQCTVCQVPTLRCMPSGVCQACGVRCMPRWAMACRPLHAIVRRTPVPRARARLDSRTRPLDARHRAHAPLRGHARDARTRTHAQDVDRHMMLRVMLHDSEL